jgi:methylenetetrahydrofolate dehydrogenase (NADP+)/methenyltetrahydrofolate cyclohydrolase
VKVAATLGGLGCYIRAREPHEVEVGQIIDGKKIAQELRAEVKAGADALLRERGLKVGLAVIRVGDDPASAIYVRAKIRACEEVGFASTEIILPAGTPQTDLMARVAALNADRAVHGILIQLPLPKGLDPESLLLAVDPAKDVDGLHPVNAGKLMTGRPGLRACTPSGIIRMLDSIGVSPKGLRAVVLGRSPLVGKPMALLLLERDATVVMCHSRTRDLEGEVRRADLVVAAIGKPELVQGAWIKEGAVVIDVGTNRLPDGRLVGDVQFAAALPRAAWISPVPGGVGPMTVATLMANTLEAARTAPR